VSARPIDRLTPYYVEVCAVTQLRRRGARPGGWGGHATMFIGGAEVDRAAPVPRVLLADDAQASETGVGISVNRVFTNANWVAVAGRDMFFHGGVASDAVLDERQYDAAVTRAVGAGWFDQIRVGTDLMRQRPTGMSPTEHVVRQSIGTDFALTFGRTAYAARLPMPRDALARVLAHLNALNDRAARDGYNWNAYTNNCSHVIHNALAAAGVWNSKNVRGQLDIVRDLFGLVAAVARRRMADLSFPANTFVRLYEAGNERPIDDLAAAQADQDIARTLSFGWITTGPGALVTRYPMHDASRNELYTAGRDPALASVPLLWDKARTFGRLTRAAPVYLTDLASNLDHFRMRYLAALAARDDDAAADDSFADRFYARLAADLARTNAAIASLSNAGVSSASPSPKPVSASPSSSS